MIAIDARGLRCPWPVLRVAKALTGAVPGTTLQIRADDPIAPGELAALARERGWRFSDAGGDLFEFVT